MKVKNIQSVCRSTFEKWLKSITDDRVRELARENTIITGGAIASMLLGEEVHDFDLYFRTREATRAVAQYYVEKFLATHKLKHKGGCNIDVSVDDWSKTDRIQIHVKSSGVVSEHSENNYQYFETTDPESGDAAEYAETALAATEEAEAAEQELPKYRPVFLTTNAITLSQKIQLVIRFYGEPDEIHANYDFVHCTCYWTSWGGLLVRRPEALEALLARDLRYVGSRYPLCSLIRVRKFIQRGWKISAGAFLKIALNLQEFDLKDVAVLEDQLTGVDAAYFSQIIEALKKRDDKVVDTSYLVELIDRLF